MYSFQATSSDLDQSHHPWRSRSDDDSPTHRDSLPGYSISEFHDNVSGRDRNDMILSPSPPPQPAQPPMEETNEMQMDPNVASLKAMFPDFDDTVIVSVLESTHHDHDRALDVLLGMNDPSFVPPPPPPPSSQSQPQPWDQRQFQSVPSSDGQRLSQEALDEQLARRLALEEEQLASQPWAAQGAEGQGAYQAYQPRRGVRNGYNGWSSAQPQAQPQVAQGQSGRDTMTEFQEGFNRIAESGKKTFTSLVSKVRAKMQEFDQGQGWSGSQSPPPGPSSQPGPSPYYQSYASNQPQRSVQDAYAQPSIPARQASRSPPTRTNTYTSSPPRSGVLHPTATAPEPEPIANAQQSSYYDPNARGYDLYGDDEEEEEEIQIADKRTGTLSGLDLGSATSAATAATAATMQSPKPTTPPQTDSSASSLPPPSSAASISPMVTPSTSVSKPSAASPPARSFSPTIMPGVKSTTAGAPAGVDFSKLGLLPKRPISLVRPQSPPDSAPRIAVAHSESTTASSTDREEPEFTENPFEDRP